MRRRLRTAPWTVAFAALLALGVALLLGDHVSWTYRAGWISIAVLAAVRPWAAFVAAAALVSSAALVSMWSGSHVPLTVVADPFVLLALLAWCRQRMVHDAPPPTTWRWAAMLLAWTAVASATVLFAAGQRLWIGDGYWQNLGLQVWRGYFHGWVEFNVLYQALTLAGGAAVVLACVDFAAGQPRRVRALAAVATAAAAAAAVQCVLRAAEVYRRATATGGDVWRLLADMRIDPVYNDVNALGPYLAMLLPAGVALAWTSAHLWSRAAWSLSAVVMAAGLWLTGSRTALAAAALVSAAAPIVLLQSRRTRFAAAVLILCLATGTALLARHRLRAETLAAGARERVEYARMSLEMFATRPVFGVGIGRYFERSNEFASPELIAGWAEAHPYENAHNNYLQVLAELGIIGFGALAVLLVGTLRTATTQARAEAEPLLVALLAGAAAFLLACFTSHPLLVRPIASGFFVVLGVLAAGGAAAARPLRRVALGRITVCLVIGAVAASVPLRGRREAAAAALDNVVIGTSRWQSPLDGVRFVHAGRHSRLFTNGTATGAILPLRLPQTAPPSRRVSIYVDGRLANIVRPRVEAWMDVVLVLPDTRKRFVDVDLVVEGEPVEGEDADELLIVGKVRPIGVR